MRRGWRVSRCQRIGGALLGLVWASTPGLSQTAQNPRALASVRVILPNIRAVDGVAVDVNAGPLRSSSNLRLIVAPASAPDAIEDTTAFALASTPLAAGRVRLTVPGGPPGHDEVRLYHVPQFGSSFEVAARAPVTVAPGVPEAVLVRDLGREAAALGPVRFEAQYRNRPILIQAQFLRVIPDTEWDIHWSGGLPVGRSASQVAIVSLGTRGIAPETSGAPNEALCIVEADSGPALDRIAALNPGDPVVVQGMPSTWQSAGSADPLLVKNCRIGP